AQRGLIPATPILCVAGRPDAQAPRWVEARRADPATIAMFDKTSYGFGRRVDHEFWESAKGAPTMWHKDSDPLGYSYTSRSGLIGPIGARDPDAAALILRAELARRQGVDTSVMLPGSSRSMVAVAMEAGLRFNRPPGLLLMSDGYPPPVSLAIATYFLY
ncbi:MAG TPA: hypothetical protein VGS21_08645, partial [Acidimicrobiales bacterium]|nr:hypothetical protein [Acidimicrobiales bacterium]